MPQPTAEARAQVVAAYQARSVAVRDKLEAVLRALWRSLPDYRDDSMRVFTARAVPLVEAAMGHMQAQTAAYLATLLAADGGTITPRATPPVTIGAVRNGADPNQVYQRPFQQVWWQLSQGVALLDAVSHGEDRVVKMAQTDVQLAKTHTSRSVLAGDKRVHGYRRVLEGPHSCGLCVVASTRLYRKAELMPVHPGCDCSVEPATGANFHDARDPEQLAAAHEAVAARFGAESTAARDIAGAFKDDGSPVLYRDVLITHDHGELGPVLGVRGQSFRSPADLN